MVARQKVKIDQRGGALAGATLDLDYGVERGQRHAHVGWHHRHTMFTAAEHGMAPVFALDSGAPRARIALVAGVYGVAEVSTASALHDVTSDRCHVTQL